MYAFYAHSLTSSTFVLLFQGYDLSGCAGVHLCHLRHVLRPCQLRSLPHPRTCQQSQAHAVHQWCTAIPVLAGQFYLGYGMRPDFESYDSKMSSPSPFSIYESVLNTLVPLLCYSAIMLYQQPWSSLSLCASNKKPMCLLLTCLCWPCYCFCMGKWFIFISF